MKWQAVRAAVLAVSLAGITAVSAQESKPGSAQEGQFKKEWAEVTKRYPAVAVAYLRREAFARGAIATRDLCGLYRVLGLELPAECRPTYAPALDYGSCFKPQRAAGGTSGMPDPADVQACLDGLRSPKQGR